MKAYELIEQFDWCQGDYALNENGAYVAPENPEAVCFCSLGAIVRCYEAGLSQDLAVQRLASEIQRGEHYLFISGGSVVVRWNDTRGRKKQDVIEMMKAADV